MSRKYQDKFTAFYQIFTGESADSHRIRQDR